MKGINKAEVYSFIKEIDKKKDIAYINSLGYISLSKVKEMLKDIAYYQSEKNQIQFLNFVRFHVDRYKYGGRCYYNEKEIIVAIDDVAFGKYSRFVNVQENERLAKQGWWESEYMENYVHNVIKLKYPDLLFDLYCKTLDKVESNRNIRRMAKDNKLYYWKDDVMEFVHTI